LYITLRFHLGSIALGSFIVALLQVIRWILSYVNTRMKVLAMAPGSRLALAVVACIGYCMRCINVVFKFATRIAYIMIAIQGKPFCSATKAGFVLISAQPITVAFTATLAWAVLLVGRIAVAGVGGYVTYLLVHTGSALMPVLCSAVLSWLVGGAFLDVYADSVDTLMVAKCHGGASVAGLREAKNNAHERDDDQGERRPPPPQAPSNALNLV